MRHLTLALPRSEASPWLDLLRGVAAFYVVLFHLRPQLFVGYGHVAHPDAPLKILYFATSVGYQFVMAFFVLSGYLISGSVLRAMAEGRWSWRAYLTQRLTRLWIVLVPALALTWVWDTLGMRSGLDPHLFADTLGWRTLLGNLLFLQGVGHVGVSEYGANVPLWSLSYEFWYYILFPCLAVAALGRQPKARILHGAVAVLLGGLLGTTVLLYFAVWLLGTAVLLVPAPRKRWRAPQRRGYVTASLGLIVGAMTVGKLLQYGGDTPDLVRSFPPELAVGVTFGFLMYVLIHAIGTETRRAVTWDVRHALAGFSYTLYLCHWPVLMVFRERLGFEPWQPDARHLLLGGAVGAGLIAYAWALSRGTEAQTGRIRDWLTGRPSRSREASVEVSRPSSTRVIDV